MLYRLGFAGETLPLWACCAIVEVVATAEHGIDNRQAQHQVLTVIMTLKSMYIAGLVPVTACGFCPSNKQRRHMHRRLPVAGRQLRKVEMLKPFSGHNSLTGLNRTSPLFPG